MVNRDRPRAWGWLIAVAVIDVLVVVGVLLVAEYLITDPGWAGRRSVYLGVAVVLIGTAVYTTWRTRRADWQQRGGS